MAAGDLATLEQAREWLQMPTAVTASDALISRLISAASTYMQNTLMSRQIAAATYVETRNGMGGDSMMMKGTPILGVSSLTISGVPVLPRSETGIGYGFTFDDQMVYLTGYDFCRGRQNVAIIYEAGYTETPPDLTQACLDMMGAWFKYQDRIGKTSESIETQSISFGPMIISGLDLSICNGYRRVSPVY